MTVNISKLSRLSREKTLANIFLFIITILGFFFFLTQIMSGFGNLTDQLVIISIVVLIVIFGHLINKNFRQPFFIEVSRYISELNDRRLDIQQILVTVDMIDPFQLLDNVGSVLNQVNECHKVISKYYEQSKHEINLSSHPFQSIEVQKLLQLIISSNEETLIEIDKKRENILILANTRRNIFKVINNRIKRPNNEIEIDYLFYKLKRNLPDVSADLNLVGEIVTHALDHGELHGIVKQDEGGETYLVIGENQFNLDSNSGFWENNTVSRDYCVICRRSISYSEQKVTCPSCGNVFHRTHLLEWLKVFNQCPMCHERMNSLL
jgi:hypothetical protein